MIRIGLLGASRISHGAILSPVAEIEGLSVTCVAARQPARARDFAARHGIPKVEADYAALVSSKDVDVVYNALPPSEHAPWSIAALRAGKHVLCEKPFALNAAEAQRMVDVADRSNGLLVEAFHYRFHPLFERVLKVLRAGEIGRIERIDCHFNVPIASKVGELRYDKRLGGGALMDLGCYPVHWTRAIMNAEPQVVSATAVWHETGVDETMNVELEFPDSVLASVQCSMSSALPTGLDAQLNVFGEHGTLQVHNPLAPHLGHQLVVDIGENHRVEQVAGGTTYFHQLQHLMALLDDRAYAITGGADAVCNMRVLDTAYRLARTD